MKYSSLSYKTYTVILLIVTVAVAIPSILTGLGLQPIDGDLTRLGFYSENDFGWNGRQYEYDPPLSEKGNSGQRYDIVIIGDSFSVHASPNRTMEGGNFTNTLASETGLKVGVFHIDDQSVLGLLQDLAEQEEPPIAIIYQTGERSMRSRLGQSSVCPEEFHKLDPKGTLSNQAAESARPAPFNRNTSPGIFDFSYTSKYLFAKLTNHRFTNRVVKARLSRDDLFSNKKSGHVLFLKDDYVKSSWSERDWNTMKCSILSMQNIVQKNGKSSFIFMVAPDKSTIYKPFITDKELPPNNLSRLVSEHLNYLRLDILLTEHVGNGKVDLYLPNNTHWSYEGHVIVAHELVNYMRRGNIIN